MYLTGHYLPIPGLNNTDIVYHFTVEFSGLEEVILMRLT